MERNASVWSPNAILPVAINKYAFVKPGICLVTVSSSFVPLATADYIVSFPANILLVDKLRK